MKHLFSFILFILFTASLFSQTIVGTDPENKNVVLEEFTGIHCGYCPQGHAIAQSILDNHPDDVVLIAIHTGGYAVPGNGEPDFRTEWGAAIAGQSGLTGYPAATVNRHLFPGWSQGSGTAMSRNYWSAAADQILASPSYLNVGAEATLVTSTRQLVVYVEVYYTGDSPNETNLLNVAVMQNNIYGYQSGGGSNYRHMHMLRHLLTGQWGIVIPETTEGTLYTASFAYELPEDIRDVELVIEDLDIGVFVTESHQEVISGILADTTIIVSNDYDAAINEVSVPQTLCSGTLSPVVTLKNYGVNNLTSLEFTYSVNGGETASYSWTGDLAQNETEQVTLPDIAYDAMDNNTVQISCSSPNGQTDQLPQNDSYESSFPGSQKYPTNCYFGVQSMGDSEGVTWNITDSEGNIIAEGGPYDDNILHLTDFSFPETGCYTLNLNDPTGTGLDGGFYVITDENTDMLWMGGDFTYTTKAELAHGMFVDVPELPGADDITVYPNPVSKTANIEFNLNGKAQVNVAVYDMLGREITNLFDGEMNSGRQNIRMDVSGMSKGMYFVRLRFNDEIITKKVMVTE
jgi:hypothetical protein